MSRCGATSNDRPGGAGGSSIGGRPRGGARPGGSSAAVPITVNWDERQCRPVTCLWRQHRHRVERVLETWVIETGWWKDDGHISRSYWRVRAGGRVFDLRYDRITKSWALERELS